MQDLSEHLQKLGIQSLNEMQIEFRDRFQPGNDHILYAPTGSGKTIAYFQNILKTLSGNNPAIQAVIIVPTRELAIQVDTVIRKMGTGFRVACVYGGHSVREEKRTLEVVPDILVGTPGRITDLAGRSIIDLAKVHTLVLDEFDKSLELGFETEMAAILDRLHALRSMMLTSATMLHSYPAFLDLHNPVTIDFLTSAEALKLTCFAMRTTDTDKMETAFRLACTFGTEPSIFFCNHREAVERLSDYFHKRDLVHTSFHGGMDQDDRERSLIRFRNGSCPVLVSTDLAARGLDVEGVAHVAHFQMPADEKSMTHRNGRTARAGKAGNVYFILSEKDYLPSYFTLPVTEKKPPSQPRIPVPEWESLIFNLGKKDKINKTDLVGFLCQTGKLDKSEIGLISVLDHQAVAAVKRPKARNVLTLLKGQKIKKKQVRVSIGV